MYVSVGLLLLVFIDHSWIYQKAIRGIYINLIKYICLVLNFNPILPSLPITITLSAHPKLLYLRFLITLEQSDEN